MNNLNGHIYSIQSEGSLSVVTLMLDGNQSLEVMVIDTPESSSYLVPDHKVSVLFKETEVILSDQSTLSVSIQNRLPCHVKKIENGTILSRVYLESAAGSFTSLLPSSSILSMKLEPGLPVLALIKFNEIMLAER